jgi:hypothetical protein
MLSLKIFVCAIHEVFKDRYLKQPTKVKFQNQCY